jgi:hypothetical protein
MSPQNSFRPTPARLIEGKVSATYDMIHDSKGHHICDIRGWRRLQYFEGGEALQYKIAKYVADAINEKLEREPI